MRKSQPTTRPSFEEDPKYRRGYEAGYEAGQRAYREQGAQQQINRVNGQPFTSKIVNPISYSQDYKDIVHKPNKGIGTNIEPYTNKGIQPIKTGRLSNEYQSRRSFDKPTLTRDNQISSQEYEINGKKLISTRDNQFPNQEYDMNGKKPISTRDNQYSNQEYDMNGKKLISTRDNRFPNQEHEMAGKTSNPEAEVQFNARGHY